MKVIDNLLDGLPLACQVSPLPGPGYPAVGYDYPLECLLPGYGQVVLVSIVAPSGGWSLAVLQRSAPK